MIINTHNASWFLHPDLQVQIKISQCPRGISNRSCVQSVAVRAGQDVFVVDSQTFTIEYTLCNDGVLNRKVQRHGSSFYKVSIEVFLGA